jgi:hypothetical protein
VAESVLVLNQTETWNTKVSFLGIFVDSDLVMLTYVFPMVSPFVTYLLSIHCLCHCVNPVPRRQVKTNLIVSAFRILIILFFIIEIELGVQRHTHIQILKCTCTYSGATQGANVDYSYDYNLQSHMNVRNRKFVSLPQDHYFLIMLQESRYNIRRLSDVVSNKIPANFTLPSHER